MYSPLALRNGTIWNKVSLRDTLYPVGQVLRTPPKMELEPKDTPPKSKTIQQESLLGYVRGHTGNFYKEVSLGHHCRTSVALVRMYKI